MQHGVTASMALRDCIASCTKEDGMVESVPDNQGMQFMFSNSWFSSVEAMVQIVKRLKANYFSVIKTSHSCFPKAYIEETMKNWPFGLHIVLEGRVSEGVDLLALGYKYNKHKVLSFIVNKESGLMEPADYY